MNTRNPWHLLLLSAKTQAALERANANLTRHFSKKPELNIEHAAFTLQVGRERFNHRKMIVCRGLADAISSMENNTSPRTASVLSKEKASKVVFLFSGGQDSANTLRNIREICAVEATFKTGVEHCLQLLHQISGLDLTDAIFSANAGFGNALSESHNSLADHAIQFIAGYALAGLWVSWGVQPKALVASGAGEYVAAVLAGICSLEEALALLVSHADDASSSADTASRIKFAPPQIPLLSGSGGAWIGNEVTANEAGWLGHPLQPAKLDLNDAHLEKLSNHILLEVGFSLQLTAEIQRACSQALKDKLVFVDLSAQSGDGDEAFFALTSALGRLALYGAAIDWKSFYHGRAVRRIPLPAYSFARERFWLLPGKTHQEIDVPDTPVFSAIHRAQNTGANRPVATNSKAHGNDYHQRPDLENDYVAPRDEIESRLAEMCGALLKIDNIGMDDNIIMLGADSMFTIQLSTQIAQIFSVQISPHHLFERPNLQSLAEKIKAKHPVISAPTHHGADDLEEMIGKMTEEEVDAMLSKFSAIG